MGNVIYDSMYLVTMSEDELDALIREVTDENPTDEDRWDFIQTENEDAYNDFCENVDKVQGAWLLTGTLGLWSGRREVYATFDTLHQAIVAAYSDCDDIRIVEDRRGKVVIYAYHHDGINVFELRKLSAHTNNFHNWSKRMLLRNSRNANLRNEFGWF